MSRATVEDILQKIDARARADRGWKVRWPRGPKKNGVARPRPRGLWHVGERSRNRQLTALWKGFATAGDEGVLRHQRLRRRSRAGTESERI